MNTRSFPQRINRYVLRMAVLAVLVVFASTSGLLAQGSQAAPISSANVTVTLGPLACGVSGPYSGWGYGNAPCSITYVTTMTDTTPGAQICYSVQLSANGSFNSGCAASGQPITNEVDWGSEYCYQYPYVNVDVCAGLYSPSGTMYVTAPGYTDSPTYSFPI